MGGSKGRFTIVLAFAQGSDRASFDWLLVIIHLVRMQNIPKNKHIWPPDTHTNVSFSENIAHVLNEWSLNKLQILLAVLCIITGECKVRLLLNTKVPSLRIVSNK